MSSTTACVDASFIARLFLGPEDGQARKLLDAWIDEGRAVCAPDLLMYELTNVFYRYHRAGHLRFVAAELVLEASLDLPLRLEPHTSLAKPALRLADARELPATYDAYYLALAERMNTELWTADTRLQQKVGNAGPVVRLID